MIELLAEAVATALMTKGTELATDRTASAWSRLVSLVRGRFVREPGALATLEAAQRQPTDLARLAELRELLRRACEGDSEFSAQLGSLWSNARVEIIVEKGSRTELTGDLHGDVVHRDVVHGDVVHARDVYVQRMAGHNLPPPRQLPVDVANFTGRAAELTMLDHLVDAVRAAAPATVVISAIAGAPGMGKTALAVHWAHRARDRFPDGDLYVNLRGYDPGSPVDPADVLGDFLLAMDVPPAKIPSSVDARAALYRSLLDQRRMIVLLDNAASAEQVWPLLPGSPSCLVLVTSRSNLSRLVARNGARRISLGLLSPADAIGLLRRVIGPERVDGEPPGVLADLAAQCGYLPLALRIVGERIAMHRHLRIADVLRDLADERSRLDVLDAAEEGEDTVMRAAFSWSYRALSPENARMFRLLGLHPGPEISVPAAAALAGVPAARAARQLESLSGVHLLEAVGERRCRFHDLLRCYAIEQNDPSSEPTRETIHRVLSWYLHTADAANRTLQPQRRRITTEPLVPGCQPLDFASHDEALDWCDTERVNLVEATELAARHGFHTVAWQLPVVLWSYFQLRQHWEDWITTHEVGIECARQVGDLHGEGWALNSLGNAHRELRQYDRAIECGMRTLAIRRELGDRYGQGTSLNNVGRAYCALGRYDEAIDHSQQALEIHREIGDRWNEGIDLNNLGHAYREQRRYDQAIDCWAQALEIQHEIGDHFGQGTSLHNLGTAYRGQEKWKDAIDHYQRALAIRREIGHRYGQAETLSCLGHVLHALSLDAAARQHWRDARVIFEEVGDPDAAAECALHCGDAVSPPGDRLSGG